MFSKVHVLLFLVGLQAQISQIQSFSTRINPTRTTTGTRPAVVTQTLSRARATVTSSKNSHGVLPLHMSTAPPAGPNPGQVIAQRRIYRFSQTGSPIQSPYSIEERQYFTVAGDRSLEKLGDKCIVFRAEDGVSDTVNGQMTVGPALYKVHGMEGIEEGSESDSSYAMALYCMKHPKIISGEGLEVGSGAGLGGILSTIGAGISGSRSPTAPAKMSKITMTDSREHLLAQVPDNLRAVSFPESKVQLGLLDWNKPVQIKDKFNFVLGCDVANDAGPDTMTPLAKTVAYSLKSSPFKRNTQPVKGTFVHVGPEDHDSNGSLEFELRGEFRFNTRIDDIVLEKIDLLPVVMNRLEDAEELEAGGSAALKSMDLMNYSLLIGYHNGEYDGTNGASVFPAERKFRKKVQQRPKPKRVRPVATAEMSSNVSSPVSRSSGRQTASGQDSGDNIAAMIEKRRQLQRQQMASVNVQKVADQPAQPTQDQLGRGFSAGKPVESSVTTTTQSGGPLSYVDQLAGAPPAINSAASYKSPSMPYSPPPASTLEPVQPTQPSPPTISGPSHMEQLGGGFSAGKPAESSLSTSTAGSPLSYTDKLGSTSYQSEGSTTPFNQQPSMPYAPPAQVSASDAKPIKSSSTIVQSAVNLLPYMDQLGGGVALGKPAPDYKVNVRGSTSSYVDQLRSVATTSATVSRTTSAMFAAPTPNSQSSSENKASLTETEKRELEAKVESYVENYCEDEVEPFSETFSETIDFNNV